MVWPCASVIRIPEFDIWCQNIAPACWCAFKIPQHGVLTSDSIWSSGQWYEHAHLLYAYIPKGVIWGQKVMLTRWCFGVFSKACSCIDWLIAWGITPYLIVFQSYEGGVSLMQGGFPPLFYKVLPHRDDMPKTPSKPSHPVHYTDTGPTSRCSNPIMLSAKRNSSNSCFFSLRCDSTQIWPWISRLRGGRSTTEPPRPVVRLELGCVKHQNFTTSLMGVNLPVKYRWRVRVGWSLIGK